MADVDTSNVRDADLLAELEAARGQFLFEFTARMIVAKQEKRDAEAAAAAEKAAALAAMPREKRRRAVTREVLETSLPDRADIRHIHSVLAICGLPYERQPIEVRDYERKQGNMAIDVTAGFLRDPNGNKILQPLPFGPKSRLILMHLCSEAIRQKSPTIEIADSFTAFVREMGFSDSGGKKGPLTAFREQLNALAACTMKVTAWNGERSRSKTFVPLEDVDLWLSQNPDQRSLWPSTVTFSQTMFESLQHHALPVNAKVVKAFSGSSRKLELYFWLGWRLHNIDKPLRIGWGALQDQFGRDYVRERKFKEKFSEDVRHIHDVLPKIPMKLDEGGLRLEPADPSVLALPAPQPTKKRS